jgi:uncharacterized protein YpmB
MSKLLEMANVVKAMENCYTASEEIKEQFEDCCDLALTEAKDIVVNLINPDDIAQKILGREDLDQDQKVWIAQALNKIMKTIVNLE